MAQTNDKVKGSNKPKRQYSRTDSRYWEQRIYKPTFKSGGEYRVVGNFYVRMAHDGRRRVLALNATAKAPAGKEARDWYLNLKANGWDAVLGDYTPPHRKTTREEILTASDRKKAGFIERPTIGDLLQAVSELSSARLQTIEAYFKAFRTIAVQVFKIRGSKKRKNKAGEAEWRKRVDSIPLDKITPSLVLAWKNRSLREIEGDPAAKRSRIVTLNSKLRNAKGCFGKKTLPFLLERMRLPEPLPFEGVPFERMPSMRYHSKIDARDLLKNAAKELADPKLEQFKILILGLVCGLRKGEIDNILWSAIDFEKRVLRVEHSAVHELKSEDSAGEIDLDDETLELFCGWKTVSGGHFIVESELAKKPSSNRSRTYRCKKQFDNLYTWLRANGVESRKPLHELRKEIGSIIASEQGIFEASRYLRHSDVRITSQIYADKKKRITSGLGSMLTSTD
ncbi:MAG: tyrosine-type recombinase/integrase [Luteolibacter sp.]